MRILIATIGTRGDIQPYIALALGLKKAGHQPIVASHPSLKSLVESYNLSFAPIGPDVDLGKEAAIIRGKSKNWIIGFSRVMKFSFRMLEESHPQLLGLCKNTDLVVISHSAAGSIEADQLGLPTVSVTLMPQAIPVNNPQDSAIKKGIMKIAGGMMGMMMTRPLNQIRKRVGVQKMGPNGITSPRLNLIPMSPEVVAPNPLWESQHQMTGYWFAESPEKWNPPADLEQFLTAGTAPVVISLGAMAISGSDTLEAAQITVEAIAKSGVRAIIQGWDEPMAKISYSANIFHAGSIPHEWLLPKAAAVIHHGGFGTTSAGLKAGIPSMAVPHIIDQFLWGQKLAELGVGPNPIPRTKLTVESMSQALMALTQDEEMRIRACELGKKIQAETGVDKAVALINESLVTL